jgi:hypothetical protein
MRKIRNTIAGIAAIVAVLMPPTALAASGWGGDHSGASASVHGNGDGSKTVVATPDPKQGKGSNSNHSTNNKDNTGVDNKYHPGTDGTKKERSDTKSVCDLNCQYQQMTNALAQLGVQLDTTHDPQKTTWRIVGADLGPGTPPHGDTVQTTVNDDHDDGNDGLAEDSTILSVEI